jgi:hypothetical protein
VSLVAPVAKSARVAERQRDPARTLTPWLIVCCYLLAAVSVTWPLWADPAARAQVGDAQDVNLFAWFMRYEATAVAHGGLPSLTTAAMNAPRGISLMWNTSLLLPGVLLAPVTLLAGPQVTLTVVLTLGFAGSAASLLAVLRRWGASYPAAAIGGAVYGFSPALLNSGIGHYNLQFAVLPPLIIDALLGIVTGRGGAPATPRGHPLGPAGRPSRLAWLTPAVRTGAWLGLLAAAQLFTGEELLTDTAVAGLALTVALVISGRGVTFKKAKDTATGLAVGAVVMLLICGRALWTQFDGPLAEQYVPRRTHYSSFLSAHPSVFVTPPGDLLFHTSASAAAAAGYPAHLSEYLAYLGWPLIVVLVAIVICYWRHPQVRVMAVTFAMLELLSLGGGYGYAGRFLPWHWLQGLPVLSQLIPDRLAIMADGAAAAVLAFGMDRARLTAAPGPNWRRGYLATAVAVLAVLPLTPLPFRAVPLSPVPAGWQAAFARLRLAAGARVLVVPIPDTQFTQAMRWQADTGEPGSLIGGFFLGPDRSGDATVSPGPATADARYLDPLWAGRRPAAGRSRAQVRADLGYWRPAAVVEVIRPRSQLEPILTGLFGRPAFRIGSLLVWRR